MKSAKSSAPPEIVPPGAPAPAPEEGVTAPAPETQIENKTV